MLLFAVVLQLPVWRGRNNKMDVFILDFLHIPRIANDYFLFGFLFSQVAIFYPVCKVNPNFTRGNQTKLFLDKEPVDGSDISCNEQYKEQPDILPDESRDICSDNQAENHNRELSQRHIPEGHFSYLLFHPVYHSHYFLLIVNIYNKTIIFLCKKSFGCFRCCFHVFFPLFAKAESGRYAPKVLIILLYTPRKKSQSIVI